MTASSHIILQTNWSGKEYLQSSQGCLDVGLDVVSVYKIAVVCVCVISVAILCCLPSCGCLCALRHVGLRAKQRIVPAVLTQLVGGYHLLYMHTCWHVV